MSGHTVEKGKCPRGSTTKQAATRRMFQQYDVKEYVQKIMFLTCEQARSSVWRPRRGRPGSLVLPTAPMLESASAAACQHHQVCSALVLPFVCSAPRVPSSVRSHTRLPRPAARSADPGWVARQPAARRQHRTAAAAARRPVTARIHRYTRSAHSSPFIRRAARNTNYTATNILTHTRRN